MTLVKAWGFEANTLLELDAYGGTSLPSISSAQKRGGAYSCYLQGGVTGTEYVDWIQLNYPTAQSNSFLQVGMYPAQVYPSSKRFLRLYSGATIVATLVGTITGTVEVWTGDKVTKVGTSSNSIPLNAWSWLEIHSLISTDAGTGKLGLRINGNLEVDWTGNTGSLNVTSFTMGTATQVINSGWGDLYIDDVILNDANGTRNNSWPNGLKVAQYKPTGVGTYSEWTPSTGANWQCVDELPPSITDYITAVLDGKRDTYQMEDCPSSISIAAVIPSFWAVKAGTPACSNVKRLMRIGGSDYAGSNLAVPTSFGLVQEVMETNPATGQPFTASEFNDAGFEFGPQSAT